MKIFLSDKSNVYVNSHMRKAYHADCQWLGKVVCDDGSWGALMIGRDGRYAMCRGTNHMRKLDTLAVLEALQSAIVLDAFDPNARPPGRPRIYRNPMRLVTAKLPHYMVEAARKEGKDGSVGSGLRRLINSGMEALGHTVPDE